MIRSYMKNSDGMRKKLFSHKFRAETEEEKMTEMTKNPDQMLTTSDQTRTESNTEHVTTKQVQPQIQQPTTTKISYPENSSTKKERMSIVAGASKPTTPPTADDTPQTKVDHGMLLSYHKKI